MEQLMSGKLTKQDWSAKCEALGIGQLMIGAAVSRVDPVVGS